MLFFWVNVEIIGGCIINVVFVVLNFVDMVNMFINNIGDLVFDVDVVNKKMLVNYVL